MRVLRCISSVTLTYRQRPSPAPSPGQAGDRTYPLYPKRVVATAVTRVTGSGHTATGCITPYRTSKYTFGDTRSRVKYIVYVVARFGSNERTETSVPSNISTTTRHVAYQQLPPNRVSKSPAEVNTIAMEPAAATDDVINTERPFEVADL